MTTYIIYPDSDPALHSRVPEFDFANPPIDPQTLVDDLLETMNAHDGIGLAANQCGLPYRVFVMADRMQTWAMFNPEVVGTEPAHDILLPEGCLSFPGLFLKIKRPSMVTLRYTDAKGEDQMGSFIGMQARCIWHELDHLDGIVFTDHVSKLKLDMAKKKISKRGL